MTRTVRYKKYFECLNLLEDEVVYSAGAIMRIAFAQGYADVYGRETKTDLPTLMRHAFSRIARTFAFPRQGDGVVEAPGKPAVIGWKGKRWKDVLTHTALKQVA